MNLEEKKLRQKIIKLALLQHHKLYEHGKHGPQTFDCAGLVWFVYYKLLKMDLYNKGFGLSTTTKIMTSSHGKNILFAENDINKDLSVVKHGDILFFHRQSKNDTIPKENNKYPGHCGIYLGSNKFIHSSRSKGKVIISDFNNNDYWKRVLVAKKDIFTGDKILNKKKCC